jgi:predicted RNA-binding protein with RPS1 domain
MEADRMTDESRTLGTENESEKQEDSLVTKLVDAAKTAGEKVSEVVGEVTEKVGEVVSDVAHKVGLVKDDEEATPDTTTAETTAAPAEDTTAQTEASAVAVEDAAETEAPVVSAEAVSEADAVAVEDAARESDIAHVFQTAKETVSEAVSNVVDGAKSVLGIDSEAEASSTEPVSAEAGTEGATFEPTSDDGTTPRRLADLEPGMELEGRVTSTALYGIFVDIGVGRDGLVHISEMSDQRIESPTDLVQIGDTVRVRVKSVDAEARRISLTMRSPRVEQPGDAAGRRRNRAPKRPEVDLDKLGQISAGDLIEGTVNGIAPFGVFVDIGVGKDGLVHISELAEGRVERAEDAVTVGQSYTFRVLEVDAEGQRISLSLRRAQEGFQERPRGGGAGSSAGGGGGRRREANLDGIAPGTILDGKVSGIAPFGAFVDLGVGRDGLVHISELAEGRIGKVEDVVNVGDAIKVRVLEVDPSSKRISLSMRLEVPVGPVSTAGQSRLDRDWTNPAARDDRPRDDRPRGDRPANRGGSAGGGARRGPAREPEVFSFGEGEEAFTGGDATLDDLLTKFGSEDTRRPSKKRYEREEEEEDGESRDVRARRDAIRRTLKDTYEE